MLLGGYACSHEFFRWCFAYRVWAGYNLCPPVRAVPWLMVPPVAGKGPLVDPAKGSSICDRVLNTNLQPGAGM